MKKEELKKIIRQEIIDQYESAMQFYPKDFDQPKFDEMSEMISGMSDRGIYRHGDEDIIEIIINGEVYYAKKIDSTHFKISPNQGMLSLNIKALDINDFKDKTYYTDIKTWLDNGPSPYGKKYIDKNTVLFEHILDGIFKNISKERLIKVWRYIKDGGIPDIDTIKEEIWNFMKRQRITFDELEHEIPYIKLKEIIHKEIKKII